MPRCTRPSRRIRSPAPVASRRSTLPCSSTPARTRCSTYSRVRDSMTIDSMPSRLRRWASMSPAGPAPMIATRVRTLGKALERERTAAALHGDPAHLGELVHREGAAETPPAAVLHTTEGHLRLVVHRLVVDMHDPGLDSGGQRRPAIGIARDDAGRESVRRRVGSVNRVVLVVDN